MRLMVTIKFWGVRGSTPCANAENMRFGGNTSCVQISATHLDELLVLDCGTGIRNLGNNIMDRKEALHGNIFLTHPHWDHLQGFAFFKPFYHPDGNFNIHLTAQPGLSCNEILQGHFSNIFFPISIDMLSAKMNCTSIEEGVYNFGDYVVEMMWGKHTIPTGMFKVIIEDKVIIYAPDNELPHDDSVESRAFIKKFKAFIQGADVLIHDAQYNLEEYEQRTGWGHTNWEKLLEITRDSQIKQLYLTHHDPDNSDAQLEERCDQIQAEYGSAYELVTLARDEMVVELT